MTFPSAELPAFGCPTCHGHPVRYVARGCAYEPVQCVADDPRREACSGCGHGDPVAQLTCDGCGGRLPETPYGDSDGLFCDLCAVALAGALLDGVFAREAGTVVS